MGKASMKTPRLKVCPFCGSRGVYRRASPEWVDEPAWTAGCEYGHATSPDLDSKKDAAEWWNTRHTGAQYSKEK